MIKYPALFSSILLTVFLLSCGGGDDPVSPGDETPPSILAVIPADNSLDISVSSNIEARFSEKILSASVTASSFVFSPAVSGSINVTDSIVTFNPSSDLAYSTTYSATLTTAISDLAGNGLAQIYTWTFTTEADPATLPPEISLVIPPDISIDIDVSTDIVVNFSKAIEPSSVNVSSFSVSGGVSGQINVNDNVATFNPDTDLEYDSLYTVTLTTAITDNFGNNLQSGYSWSFRTETLIPTAYIFLPEDSVITGDTVSIQVATSHPIGVDSVQFYVDDNLTPSYTDLTEPFDFELDASVFAIGSEHKAYAIAYDAADNAGYSDTLTFYYLWKELITDGNDGFSPLEVPNDLRRMLARSTDSTLELRYEYAADWVHPYFDTAVDLGIFFDTDLNILTGRRDAAGDTLNDIGADFRIILGLHGGDTALSEWNPGSQVWDLVYDTNGFVYHNLPQDTNIMEISFKWDDINNVSVVNIVSANVFFRNSSDPSDFITDFMPDNGNGHVTVYRNDKFIGKPAVNKTAEKLYSPPDATALPNRANPFD